MGIEHNLNTYFIRINGKGSQIWYKNAGERAKVPTQITRYGVCAMAPGRTKTGKPGREAKILQGV